MGKAIPTNRRNRLDTLLFTELNMLLYCVRILWNPSEAEQLKYLLTEKIDWDRFTQLAVEHRLAALVYKNLRGLRDQRVPDAVLAKLRQYFLANIQNHLRLGAELAAILEVFQKHAIQAVPFKGLVLAAEFYDPPELRPPGDLDVIVDPQDADKSMALLTTLGFRSELAALHLNTVQINAYRKVAHGFQFFHDLKSINLDLHWRFATRFQDLPIDFCHIEKNLRTQVVSESEMPTLALQDMIQYLCYHGQHNYWQQLCWVCDVAAFMQRYADTMDWYDVLADADRLNNRHRLLLGLWLAHELLDSPLPEPIKSCLLGDKKISVRAEMIYAGLVRRAQGISASRLSRLQDSYTRLRLAQGLRAKGQAIMEPMFSPRPADFIAMPLPASLFPLYYVLRPLRLIGKYCARLKPSRT